MHFAIVVLLALVAITAGLPQRSVRPALNLKELLAGRQGRIVGGKDAARDEFPYQVSYQWEILGKRQHVCGGSILNERWILTAAHCVTELPQYGTFYIFAGILNLDEQVSTRQEIKVVEKITHANYPGGVAPYDIALLLLASDLVFSESVKPISLPAAGSVPDGTAQLSGWGAISAGGIVMPKILQKSDMPLLSYAECAKAVAELQGGQVEPLHETNVCTGPLTGGLSACSGDSGGPLALDGVLIGIVSWGWTPCGSEGCPSVYTGVSNYIDWINERINN